MVVESCGVAWEIVFLEIVGLSSRSGVMGDLFLRARGLAVSSLLLIRGFVLFEISSSPGECDDSYEACDRDAGCDASGVG